MNLGDGPPDAQTPRSGHGGHAPATKAGEPPNELVHNRQTAKQLQLIESRRRLRASGAHVGCRPRQQLLVAARTRHFGTGQNPYRVNRNLRRLEEVNLN